MLPELRRIVLRLHPELKDKAAFWKRPIGAAKARERLASCLLAWGARQQHAAGCGQGSGMGGAGWGGPGPVGRRSAIASVQRPHWHGPHAHECSLPLSST